MIHIMSRREDGLKYGKETWTIWFSSSERPYDTDIDMQGYWFAVW